MHVGKWPQTDFFLYATSSCDNVKAFHTLGRRYGIPRFRHGAALPPVHAAGDGALEERAQAADRLPGGADGKEDGLRPPEGDGAPVLPSHRARPRDRRARCPCPDAHVRRMLRRRAAGAAPDVPEPRRRGLPGIAEGGAPGAGGPTASPPSTRSASGSCGAASPRSGTRRSMAFMQQKYGAVSVCEVLSGWRGEAKWLLDPDDPLGNLAYRTQLAPGNCQYSPSRRLGRAGRRPGPQVQGGRGDLQQQLGLQAGGGPRPDRQGRTAASLPACRRSRSTWT